MCGFKEKFQMWKDWWNGGDENSIINQIYSMMWYAAIFEILKQVHNFSLSRNSNKELPNWAFWNFVFTTHFETQTNAIMRLLDKSNDVISLRRLVSDIKENCLCLTRKDILDSLNLPYDYENSLTISGSGTFNQSYAFAELMHKQMDLLANIPSGSQRQPSDMIRKCVIDWIEKRLETVELKDIKKYRNKFVAHAATNKSRDGKDLKDMKITLRKISKAHEIICKTANFIAQNIFFDGRMSFLAGNIQDVLENLDKPLVSQENIPGLLAQLNEFKKQTEQWCKWDWSSEFEKSCP